MKDKRIRPISDNEEAIDAAIALRPDKIGERIYPWVDEDAENRGVLFLGKDEKSGACFICTYGKAKAVFNALCAWMLQDEHNLDIAAAAIEAAVKYNECDDELED